MKKQRHPDHRAILRDAAHILGTSERGAIIQALVYVNCTEEPEKAREHSLQLFHQYRHTKVLPDYIVDGFLLPVVTGDLAVLGLDGKPIVERRVR